MEKYVNRDSMTLIKEILGKGSAVNVLWMGGLVSAALCIASLFT